MTKLGRALLVTAILVGSLGGCAPMSHHDCYDMSRTLLLNRGGVPPVGGGYC